MSFEDLPDDFGDRPLTEPRFVADVLDLFVSEASREAGALYLLLCDAEDRLMHPVGIDDVTQDCDIRDCELVLSTFAELLSEDQSLLVAIARRGVPSPTQGDLRWLTVARHVCRRTDVRLLGVHVVTPSGQHQLTAA